MVRMKRSDVIMWTVAVLVGALVAVVSSAAGARLGAALSGSAIAITAVVVARMVMEERTR
jgi:hypothetical protein